MNSRQVILRLVAISFVAVKSIKPTPGLMSLHKRIFNSKIDESRHLTTSALWNSTDSNTTMPSFAPSKTSSPSYNPTLTPSASINPSSMLSLNSSNSINPSSLPSDNPSVNPSFMPSSPPSVSLKPSFVPSNRPSTSFNPSSIPSFKPSKSSKPSYNPSFKPSLTPSASPSDQPSSNPSYAGKYIGGGRTTFISIFPQSLSTIQKIAFQNSVASEIKAMLPPDVANEIHCNVVSDQLISDTELEVRFILDIYSSDAQITTSAESLVNNDAIWTPDSRARIVAAMNDASSNIIESLDTNSIKHHRERNLNLITEMTAPLLQQPSSNPSISMTPSLIPSTTMNPSTVPSVIPSISSIPSVIPSSIPSNTPSLSLNPSTSISPSVNPTKTPEPSKTSIPSSKPSSSFEPSYIPSNKPSIKPSKSPSYTPSHNPSQTPSKSPMPSKSYNPSNTPSQTPSKSSIPSKDPSKTPSYNPSDNPSQTPSKSSSIPSKVPSKTPSLILSVTPSYNPSDNPSPVPSESSKPSLNPTILPTDNPTKLPTKSPTKTPSSNPTETIIPSYKPSQSPTELKENILYVYPKDGSLGTKVNGNLFHIRTKIDLSILELASYVKKKENKKGQIKSIKIKVYTVTGKEESTNLDKYEKILSSNVQGNNEIPVSLGKLKCPVNVNKKQKQTFLILSTAKLLLSAKSGDKSNVIGKNKDMKVFNIAGLTKTKKKSGKKKEKIIIKDKSIEWAGFISYDRSLSPVSCE